MKKLINPNEMIFLFEYGLSASATITLLPVTRSVDSSPISFAEIRQGQIFTGSGSLQVSTFLFPVSCFLFPVPCFLSPVPCFLTPVPCFLTPVPYFIKRTRGPPLLPQRVRSCKDKSHTRPERHGFSERFSAPPCNNPTPPEPLPY